MPEAAPLPSPDVLPNDSQLMTVALVGPGRNVLELGCSAGHVTRRLVDNGCTVTGIEIDPDMAEAARELAAEVLVADLDLVLPEDLLGNRRFEVIVVGDVFEHLKRPVEVLRSLAGLLEPGGRLVTSIPNVTHVDVRLMLLGGRWRYQDGGLLDRTHLRFFDAQGVDELFAAGGFTPLRIERTTKGVFESELAPLAEQDELPPQVLERALADAEATTYQFVVEAVPAADAVRAEPALAQRGTAPAASGNAVQRLLEENEYLRVRVRSLEEDVEQVRWTLERERAAHPARRARAVASRTRDAFRSLRSGAGR
ncbi:MAG: class I SAM-dependent methyltransferase [Microthrixaceae bacterium]